jgi:hypothetical protein
MIGWIVATPRGCNAGRWVAVLVHSARVSITSQRDPTRFLGLTASLA